MMAAGILHLYSEPRKSFTAGNFFQGTATYAFRFLGILLLGWMFFIVLLEPFSRVLDSLGEKIARQSISEVMPFYLNLTFSVFLIFLYLFFQMVFDYARINTVIDNQENILRSVWSGLRFVFRHPGSVLGLMSLGILGQAALTVVYLWVRYYIPQIQFVGILSAFIWLQFFICSLIWVRCALYASQMSLYRFYQ